MAWQLCLRYIALCMHLETHLHARYWCDAQLLPGADNYPSGCWGGRWLWRIRGNKSIQNAQAKDALILPASRFVKSRDFSSTDHCFGSDALVRCRRHDNNDSSNGMCDTHETPKLLSACVIIFSPTVLCNKRVSAWLITRSVSGVN